MKKRILLLGSTGLLGLAIKQRLQEPYDLLCPSSTEVDIRDPDSVLKLHSERFDYLINATGYTQVDQAQTDSEAAFLLNATAVSYLAKLAAKQQVPIIHFSTDYVFDGTLDRPYREDDPSNPISVYGASKWEGEQCLRAVWYQHYIFRVQWLYGDKSPNFIEQMLKLAKTHSELTVVSDQYGTPTYVGDIAAAISYLLSHQIDIPYGTYHLRADGDTHWADYAREIFKIKGHDLRVKNVDSSAYPRLAKRPKNGILDPSKFFNIYQMDNWKKSLKKYLDN